MTFGERLFTCIKNANITQKELAAQIGATPTQLNYWIKDKRQPDIPYIRSLAKVLNVSADYLIGNDVNVLTSDILYISRPSGDINVDELRKYLHEVIDSLSDEDLGFFKDFTLRIKK